MLNPLIWILWILDFVLWLVYFLVRPLFLARAAKLPVLFPSFASELEEPECEEPDPR